MFLFLGSFLEVSGHCAHVLLLLCPREGRKLLVPMYQQGILPLTRKEAILDKGVGTFI